MCLEFDEGNQHLTPISDKLRAYRGALEGRPGWHVLFVVPTSDRAAWLRRSAHGVRDGFAWVTTLDELRGCGLGARLAPVPGPSATPMVLGGLGAGPSPLAGPAVGSRRWLEVLGSGGAETSPLVQRAVDDDQPTGAADSIRSTIAATPAAASLTSLIGNRV